MPGCPLTCADAQARGLGHVSSGTPGFEDPHKKPTSGAWRARPGPRARGTRSCRRARPQRPPASPPSQERGQAAEPVSGQTVTPRNSPRTPPADCRPENDHLHLRGGSRLRSPAWPIPSARTRSMGVPRSSRSVRSKPTTPATTAASPSTPVQPWSILPKHVWPGDRPHC